MQFRKLFSPIKIGSLEVNNRFVVPPMGFDLADEGGVVSQAAIDYWVARAKGGWGLLIFEFTAIDPLGKAGPRQVKNPKFGLTHNMGGIPPLNVVSICIVGL